MRGFARIDAICDVLKQKWKLVPDQRLGQFLLNYVFGKNPPHTAYIFYKRDDDTLDVLLNIDNNTLIYDNKVVHISILELLQQNEATGKEIRENLDGDISDDDIEKGLCTLLNIGLIQSFQDVNEEWIYRIRDEVWQLEKL